MRNSVTIWKRAPLAVAVSAALGCPAWAQAAEGEAAQATGPIEEVVVMGRLISGAESLVEERKDDDSLSNLIGSEFISRAGDATVAAALRRVSGITLVNGEFIYVRGLGERYSSTTLNGARVPSPDLTRNVIPLDIFPTAIVESLQVQKSYSPDMRANFGGGNIDIRTKGFPDDFVASVQVGGGFNTENDGEVFTYAGGGDDNFGTDDGTRELNPGLVAGIDQYQGDIGVQSIFTKENARGNPITLAGAQQINRDLALLLNRDVSVKEKDIGPDVNLRGAIGNSFYPTERWQVGFLVGAAYETEWRERQIQQRNFNQPDELQENETESTYNVDITANANLGARWADEQEITLTSLWLRNTDDETRVTNFFNENRVLSSGRGFQDVSYRWEERELTVNQLRGSHRFGYETRDLVEERLPESLQGLKPLLDWVPNDLEYSWFYSDSEATTDIPNQVRVSSLASTDPVTGAVLDTSVALSPNSADYRFTDLEDSVEDSGWNLKAPWFLGDSYLEIEIGQQFNQQNREYFQTDFGLGILNVASIDTISGPLGGVFSDANVTDFANNYELFLNGTANQSYIAATMTDASYGKVDFTWRDTWRIAAGVRYEEYRQVALDVSQYNYSIVAPVVTTDPDELVQRAFIKDDWYPSVSVTYIDDWLAETFQLRFAYSSTVVRPDLREITDATYVDPITEDLIAGNPNVVPAELENYDIRAEWFFSNGDSFTVSLFYKDITNPIEFFEAAASDTNTAREIVNADSAEVYGVEMEWLKELGFLGEWAEPFFFQGNVTWQDSELVAGPNADAPTSPTREITNASPLILNMVLGYDSFSGRHSGTLVFNAFDERLYVAGRNGAPDGFQQPFYSLDATYFFYPSENITFSAKLQNILNDDIEIEREGVNIYREDIGATVSFTLQWDH